MKALIITCCIVFLAAVAVFVISDYETYRETVEHCQLKGGDFSNRYGCTR